MTKPRRLIATGAFALAATGAAVVGTVVTAPVASAAVAPGDYTFTTVNFGIPSASPASVQNGVLTLFSPLGPLNYQIIDVPGGGFIDSGQGQRYYLGGENFFGPFLIGNNTLTPR
ncbi:hypothetical protein [Rhodococcus erythropolis]|uniref:Uncharacterized protein n=1 Tax=Rhodococcus erythropolis (strain PR4 / NBRC 100887) TaxID=234621 RepID=C0ZYZ6_RHOE4|nr:hypothetical protein [Rhodococcus erythropolis]BAH33581.1 hypothetical protein RER_28730 [Rhodococcus erythropolis PR4]